MENVLVTGANGFVGAALAERLLAMDKRVVALIRDLNYKTPRGLLDDVSVVRGDLRDFDAVRYAVSKYEIDTIFHLGAVAIVKVASADPRSTYDVNVMGTVNVLEAARQCGHVDKVTVASSDKAYGVHEQLPYEEDFALHASDPYSTSKACTDLISQSYALTYGLDVSILRSGNIYGPGDLNDSRIIPRTVLRILDGEPPVLYQGAGESTREFMYIDDVVDAYLAVAANGGSGEAYNVGGSGEMKIRDLMELIIEEMGADIEIEERPRDFFEIDHQYLDASKLEALGWSARVGVHEGIRRTIPWYREFYEQRRAS